MREQMKRTLASVAGAALLVLGAVPACEEGDGGGGDAEEGFDLLTFPPDAFAGIEPADNGDDRQDSQQMMAAMMHAMNVMDAVDTGGQDAGMRELPPSSERTRVGEPCDTADDCAPGLTCHQDFEDYVSHGQCTTHCTSSDACREAWGQDTMCIGAEVCVSRCLFDSDCPTLTRCGNAGWCERTGEGSGNPFCSGSPLPCSLLSDSECRTALGCRDDSDCTGVSDSCYSYYSSGTCSGQDGCYWSYSSEDCTGVSRSCSSITLQSSCIFQDGCSWRSDCSGTQLASTCAGESVGLCPFTAGCTVIYP